MLVLAERTLRLIEAPSLIETRAAMAQALQQGAIMNREALLYFIAAGLFAVAAGITVGAGRTIDASAVLLLAAGIVFAWLGARKRSQGS